MDAEERMALIANNENATDSLESKLAVLRAVAADCLALAAEVQVNNALSALTEVANKFLSIAENRAIDNTASFGVGKEVCDEAEYVNILIEDASRAMRDASKSLLQAANAIADECYQYGDESSVEH